MFMDASAGTAIIRVALQIRQVPFSTQQFAPFADPDSALIIQKMLETTAQLPCRAYRRDMCFGEARYICVNCSDVALPCPLCILLAFTIRLSARLGWLDGVTCLEEEPHDKHLEGTHAYDQAALDQAEVDDAPLRAPYRAEVPVFPGAEILLVARDRRELSR